ncbi:hypothetical protein PVL29_002293 [Vitis rotundifolia]|uniref:Phosphatidylinositol-glycan biosynthesis class X protein n=2 Tax=Vitis rotundifolia TaxID=103349 RepID=A0AA39AJ77_VITRO|nr:hypothetical protein PVL29_002293 [Vitis rotundifolia]
MPPSTVSYHMESWQHVQVHICRILGIQLIFLVGFGFCMSSSFVSCEVGRCTSNVGSTNQSLNIPPYFEKYITKSYFDKYDSLLDSDFLDFISHELFPGSCELLLDNLNLVLRLSVQQRSLIGDGSHRHLSSSFRFNIQSELIAELPIHFCEAIIIEKLPYGIFADPFELQHLLQRGVFMDAAVFGDTNLELPSVHSNRSLVEVHMDVDLNTFSRHKDGLEINIDLPLHIRYPPLEESGYSSIELGAPDLFMRCSIEAKSHNQSCLLMLKDNGVALGNGPVVWRVPSGIKAHARAVSIVTFISAILSTLSIVLTSVYYSSTKLCKNLKQS